MTIGRLEISASLIPFKWSSPTVHFNATDLPWARTWMLFARPFVFAVAWRKVL